MLKDHPKKAGEMWRRVYNYVIKNYTRKVQAQRMLGVIRKLV